MSFPFRLAVVAAACGLACEPGAVGHPPAPAPKKLGPSGGEPSTSARPSPAGQSTSASAQAAKRAPSASRRLRIATWNIEWLSAEEGKGELPRSAADYASLRKYAERLDADVVALQEVDGAAAAARVFDPQRYAFHFTSRSAAQRTGFAYRHTLTVTPNPDYRPLGLGGLRFGADLTVHLGATDFRLLSVHLKSGCFQGELRGGACDSLARQLPRLEAWMDSRAAAGVPFAVLGDFNRRLFESPGDPFWRELDDATPAESDLASPTEGYRPKCWDSRHRYPIDHLVLSKTATQWLSPGSFGEVVYEASDAKQGRRLSDHCPLVVELRVPPNDSPATVSTGVRPPAALAGQPIKGNRNRAGRRLYHLPTCPQYSAVTVREAEGDRLFASESEAQAAGFVIAGDCP